MTYQADINDFWKVQPLKVIALIRQYLIEKNALTGGVK